MRKAWIVILVGLILAIAVLVQINNRSLRNQRDAWMRKAAERDSIAQIAEGRYRRAAVELDSERQLRRAYEEDLPELRKELRSLRAKERAYLYTIAALHPDTTTGTVTDTVYVNEQGTEVSRINYTLVFEGSAVTGYILQPQGHIYGGITYQPIPLHIVVSQLRDGSWQTDIKTAPYLTISALETSIVQRRPSWWQRNKFWVGLAGGYVLKSLIGKHDR